MPNEHQIYLVKLKHVENKFIIGYAGGMGEANALDYLLAAVISYRSTYSTCFGGDGPNKQSIIGNAWLMKN